MSAPGQRDRIKSFILSTLAVAPAEGRPELEVYSGLNQSGGLPTPVTNEIRSAALALVSEGSISRYVGPGNAFWIRKESRAMSNPHFAHSRNTPIHGPSSTPGATPFSSSAAAPPGHKSEREWRKIILGYIDRMAYSTGRVLVTDVGRHAATAAAPARLEKRVFSSIMMALHRDRIIQINGTGPQQSVWRTPAHERAKPVETIDLTGAVDHALSGQSKFGGSQATSSRNLPRTSTYTHRAISRGSVDPNFSEAKIEWTRRRLRDLCGHDQKKVFEVLRLIIPSIRGTERQNLRVEDVSLECLKKVYRYMHRCELEQPTIPFVPSSNASLATGTAHQPTASQEEVKRAILGASNKKLCETLSELCKMSPALSRAVVRCLEPTSEFSRSTIKPGSAAETNRIKQERSIKAEPGIKTEAGPSANQFATPQTNRADLFGSSSTAHGQAVMTPRIKPEPGSAEQAIPSSSKPRSSKSSGFKTPVIVVDEDPAPSTPALATPAEAHTKPSPLGSDSSEQSLNAEANTSFTSKRPVTGVTCSRCSQTFDPADNRAYDCRKHTGALQPDWSDPLWDSRNVFPDQVPPPDPESYPDMEFLWNCCWHDMEHAGCTKAPHEEEGS